MADHGLVVWLHACHHHHHHVPFGVAALLVHCLCVCDGKSMVVGASLCCGLVALWLPCVCVLLLVGGTWCVGVAEQWDLVVVLHLVPPCDFTW